MTNVSIRLARPELFYPCFENGGFFFHVGGFEQVIPRCADSSTPRASHVPVKDSLDFSELSYQITPLKFLKKHQLVAVKQKDGTVPCGYQTELN